MLGAKGVLDYLLAQGIVRDVQFVNIPSVGSGITSPQTYALPYAVPDFNNSFCVEMGVQNAVGRAGSHTLWDYTFYLSDAATITYARGATNDSTDVTSIAVVTLAPGVLRSPVQQGSIAVNDTFSSATYTCAPQVGPMHLVIRNGQFYDPSTDGLGAAGWMSVNAAGTQVTAQRVGTHLGWTVRFALLDFLA